MKILCEYSDGGSSFVRKGWQNVFSYCNYEFKFWQPSKQSAFDAFEEFNPQIFIGTTYGLDRAVYKCIAKRPQMKVAMFASAWGERADKLDPKKFPITRVNEQEKALLEKLKKEIGKPDFVFIHSSDQYLESVLGGWRNLGIEPVGIMNAADIFIYRNGKPDKDLECDVGFVGGYWPYKSENLAPFILPLCQINSGLKTKIFGYGDWPTSSFLGGISQEDERNLYAMAKVSISISEPHSTSQNYSGDIIERVFKIPACGGFLISDYVEEIKEVFKGIAPPMAKTPSELKELIEYYIKDVESRFINICTLQEEVLKKHTYFDRVAKMMMEFGLEVMSNKIIDCKEFYIKSMGT